jgi:NhaP-type Na+/H+ or K+/H+ antiporter
MILSLSLIILLGFSLSTIANQFKLPRIIGLILTGMILGPFALNLIADDVLTISLDLRQIALLIILLRAGLSLNLKELKAIGRPAILLSFLPALFEFTGALIIGPIFFGLTLLDAAILGAIFAAVSPAIVIPRMLELMKQKRGTDKLIPQMIMAGASIDDVFVIVVFTALVQIAQQGSYALIELIKVPIGIVLGIFIGFLLSRLFVHFFKKYHIRDTNKVLIILSAALFFLAFEYSFKTMMPFSGLLATLSLGIGLLLYYPVLAKRLVIKYEKIWIFSEILLFVLVGASVDFNLIFSIGLIGILFILLLLIVRSIGVWVSLINTNLNAKEKLFTIFSYLPKATVQASIGSIPLALGLSSGSLMLTIAVLAIFITAPLGATLIDIFSKNLNKDINSDF